MTSKVNIILITHEEVGAALLHAAAMALGELPLPTKVITVGYDVEPEKISEKLKKFLNQTNKHQAFLVLTDLYGATPCNIASGLQKIWPKEQIHVVSGLNLPMLIRVMNYAELTLLELAQKAVSGGRDGVIDCQASVGNI